MITLWHNPRCAKSRAALKLLEDKGAPVTVRRYLVDRPNREELDHVLLKLGLPACALIRTGEKAYTDQNLAEVEDDSQLRDAMIDTPILIERPIAFHSDKAVIGRPPEVVLSLLD
ncbi:MAG: arsenate reductase (glutaredoxin) [Aliishimia sp.]